MYPAQGIDRPPTLIVQRLSGCTDLVQLARLHPKRYPFLLQSEAANDQLARFDILFAFPLTDYYRTKVIGGNGAFVITANTFKDYPEAIRKKLLREIQPPLVMLEQPASVGRSEIR